MTRRARGFTLVEVLVALLAMSLMAAMAWRGIDALARSREIAQERLTQTTRLQTVIAQWESDLRALQDSHTDLKPLSFDGGGMTLTRQAPDGLQLVVWSLREGSLWRWESPSLRTVGELENQRQLGQQQLAQRNPALRAFDGISGLQLYCFWDNAWSNCLSDGQSGQNGPSRPEAPKGIRLTLQFAGGNGLSGSLVRELEISAR